MTLRIIPDYDIFHAILRKDVSFTGVHEMRDAFNILVKLNVMYGVKILLPKLIEDKIRDIISPSQQPHFYSIVDRDTSTSGEAGYSYLNCLTRTAKTNSFKSRVIILSDKDLQKPELIEGNKKVVVMPAHKFITLYEVVTKAFGIVKPESKFLDFLILMMFFNASKMHELYKEICNAGTSVEDLQIQKGESPVE